MFLLINLIHFFYFRDNLCFDDDWTKSLKRKNDEKKRNSTISKTVNKKIDVIEPIINIKAPELDKELHDALLLDVKVDNIQENINSVKEFNPKKYKVNNNDTITEYLVNNISPKNNNKICIYFNKDCYSGGHVVKKKMPTVPNSIGPDNVFFILKRAITILVGLDYFPWNALKKIKDNENMLFNGPGRIKILISTKYVFHFIIIL